MCYKPTPSDEKNAVRYRREVQTLFFERHWPRPRIAAHLGVSRMFVHRWTQDPTRPVEADGRGWPKGQARRWPDEMAERLVTIAHEMRADPHEFFTGASAVMQRYRRQFPDEPVPSLRTVGRTLAAASLTSRPRGRSVGAARYLCYPEHTIYTQLGDRVAELDAIGPKYLQGAGTPLYFLGMCFKKPPRLRHFVRTADVTAATLMAQCAAFFEQTERPCVIKVDNAAAMSGSQSAPRTVSRFIQFLLARTVTPVFAVPRRPFTQASIEGNNSVFARTFWRRRTFESYDDVDRQLRWFNAASARYTEYTPPVEVARRAFEPKVYFIRQVQEREPGHAMIHVANASVRLPTAYVNLFVLAEWHLGTQQLTVSLERDQRLEGLLQIPFRLHPKTRLDPGIRV